MATETRLSHVKRMGRLSTSSCNLQGSSTNRTFRESWRVFSGCKCGARPAEMDEDSVKMPSHPSFCIYTELFMEDVSTRMHCLQGKLVSGSWSFVALVVRAWCCGRATSRRRWLDAASPRPRSVSLHRPQLACSSATFRLLCLRSARVEARVVEAWQFGRSKRQLPASASQSHFGWSSWR